MRNNPGIDEWLKKLHPDLQEITGDLIAVARKNMMGAVAKVHAGMRKSKA